MIIKYEKIMQDILKDFNKGRRCKTKWLFDLSDDTYIYIAIDGHYILSVPRCLWLLDTEKIINQGATLDHNHCFTTVNITALIKGAEIAKKQLVFENYKRLKDKKEVAIFGADDLEVVIDNNFFKYIDLDLYDIPAEVAISGSTEKAPLFIHDNYNFVACLLPIANAN